MNYTPKDMIDKRCSLRRYDMQPLAPDVLEAVRVRMAALKPLYPDIRVEAYILPTAQVRQVQPWRAPHYLAIYSEVRPGAEENVGFLYQQLELYLYSIGLGACWIGLGRPRQKAPAGMRFFILVGFGRPETPHLRAGAADFRRKAADEIADTPDDRLEPARLAPSSVNSQPWYFVHRGVALDVYCVMPGSRKGARARLNLMDVGIALGQLYVAYPDDFTFFADGDHGTLEGYRYVGSLRLA